MKTLVLTGLLSFPLFSVADDGSRLINGTPVPAGQFKEVVRIQSNGAGCTATIVGPKVIVTAAHCADTGATATFTLDGKKYSAKMTRSSIYPGKDHDISVGVLDTSVSGIDFASIGGKATSGIGITLLGYGCINPGGGGGNDGVLRMGDSVVTGFQNYDMVSRKAGGAALCFGDSGGPAFVMQNNKHMLLGINSKGNIQDTNYNTRTDITESQNFLKGIAQNQNLEICGINKDCGGEPPPPPAPKCTLTANPEKIKIGSSLAINIVTTGEVTSAKVDGKNITFPTGSITLTPSSIGNFVARATITGPGGSGNCDAAYVVEKNDDPPPPVKPSCTMTAMPNEVNVGESVTIEMKSEGTVSSATIDNISVNIPLGKRIITTNAKGTFYSYGSVSGAQGSGTCWVQYKVTEGITPPPETPNYAVVPAYCGYNTLAETKVGKVCVGVVKKDTTIPELRVSHAVIINYTDGSPTEILPIIGRSNRPKGVGETQVKEDLTMYANASVAAPGYQVLDTRAALLTKNSARNAEVPTAIEGRTAKGRYFIVEQLKSRGISD